MENVIDIINQTEDGFNPFELKVGKVSDEERLKNMNNVIQCVSQIIERIKTANNLMPESVLHIALYLSKACNQLFPDNQVIKYTVIGGFIFLRFLCPAIITPDLYNLVTSEMLNDSARPTLILISKILQLIANQKMFDERQRDLMDLNPFMINWCESYREWIAHLVSYDLNETEVFNDNLYIPNLKYDKSKKIIQEKIMQNKVQLLDNLNSNTTLNFENKESLRLMIENIDLVILEHQNSPRNPDELEYRYEKKTVKSIVNFRKSVSLARTQIPPAPTGRFNIKLKPPDFSFSSLLKLKKDKSPPLVVSPSIAVPRGRNALSNLKSIDEASDNPKILSHSDFSPSLHDDYVDQVHILKQPKPSHHSPLQIELTNSPPREELYRSRRHAIGRNRNIELPRENRNKSHSHSEIMSTSPNTTTTPDLFIQSDYIIRRNEELISEIEYPNYLELPGTKRMLMVDEWRNASHENPILKEDQGTGVILGNSRKILTTNNISFM